MGDVGDVNENDGICIHCDESLVRPQFRDAVIDHCHITGQYRGAAHNTCNRSYFRIDPKRTIIPVVFHNLKEYDANHLMRHIAEIEPAAQGASDLRCIPNNNEKYISFSLGGLRFIDSCQFLPESLENLVSSNKHEDFEIISRFVRDPENRGLLLCKGVYPYEYMGSFERFDEPSISPKESFYSKLRKSGITDEDYDHAKQVWEAFGCENLGDCHDLYLATDALLLADVFENFRKTCLEHYGLDPAHYYTSPDLSWDALFKHTGIQLELLTDYNKYLFIEKGTRGGVSTEMKRYCKANNPYLQDYNPNEETTYIHHLDANNLYGWAMSQYLPVGNFSWLRNMPTEEQIKSWQPDRKRGFILEVDLEYPPELHDEHNSYPLAPEIAQVPEDWMSPYQQALARELNLGKDRTQKLLLTLRDKERYVLHYRNLQLYLSLGMKLERVHNVLAFDQQAWMKSYISLNTELRKQATSTFEKNFFKLMNNSVFGKTMENLRNRTVVKLVRAGEDAKAPIQPALRKSISIRRKPCGNPDAQRKNSDEQTGLHRHVRPRSLQNPDVQVLLPAPQVQVRRALRAALHRHGLAPPRDPDGEYLRRHGVPPGALRHKRLPQGPYPPQLGEQEGHRQDEGRVQRQANLRGRLPALQDVLHFDRGRRKQNESEGHHQGCHKERGQPPELQGRPLRQAILQARDGHVPKYRPPDLYGSSPQDNTFPLRLQALDIGGRHPHAGVRAQRHRGPHAQLKSSRGKSKRNSKCSPTARTTGD